MHLSTSSIPPALRRPLLHGLVAGLAVALFSLFLPNQYKAVARILPADSKGTGGGGQMAAAAAAAGVAVPGQEGSDAAFVDILNSRWMAKKLLADSYEFTTRSWYFGSPVQHKEILTNYLKTNNLDKGHAHIKGYLKVSRDFRSKLLTITAETPSPELSQQLVRKAVVALESFTREKAQTRGGNKAIFTAERLKEAEVASTKAEQESLAFLGVHRNYATSNEPAIRLKGAQLEAALKLRQQVVTTLTLNYEQALLEEKNDMPILNVLDEGDLPQEKSGPARSNLVLTWAFLAAALSLVIQQRTWILHGVTGLRQGTSSKVAKATEEP